MPAEVVFSAQRAGGQTEARKAYPCQGVCSGWGTSLVRASHTPEKQEDGAVEQIAMGSGCCTCFRRQGTVPDPLSFPRKWAVVC